LHLASCGMMLSNIPVVSYQLLLPIVACRGSSFRTISLRIPYDNAQICEGYSFPSSTALLQQYPTLRITMYPYDDGQPASITSDTKGEEKEQEKAPKKKEKKSCAQVKMEKATKCAKQLAEVQLSNEGGGDGKMSEKVRVSCLWGF
jgi:hypothetical protein